MREARGFFMYKYLAPCPSWFRGYWVPLFVLSYIQVGTGVGLAGPRVCAMWAAPRA